MTVQLFDIGRSKACPVVTVSDDRERALDDIALHAKRYLISGIVDAQWDAIDCGTIIVGGWRPVGGFRVMVEGAVA